jgi:diguanylate cyclase (GGDEF)-like protein/PAS domain S-box-containing protein
MNLPNFGIGSNYLAACDAATAPEAREAQAAARGIRSVLEGRASTFGMEYICRTDNVDHCFRMCVSPLSTDRLDGAVILHDDITPETMAASKLRDSEHRFRQIAESIRDVFFLRDTVTGEMLYVSPAYEEIWGRTCQSLYAVPASWMAAVHPDDAAMVEARLVPRPEGGNFTLDFRLVRPDGAIHWIEYRAFPILDDTGRLIRIASIASDISDRKAAKARIAQLNRVHAMLSGISSSMVRAGNRTDLFAGVCQVAVNAGGFLIAWIGIVDPASSTLVPVAKAGQDLEFLDDLDYSLLPGSPLADSLTGRALRGKQTEFSNDLGRAPSVYLSAEHALAGRRSLAIVPLIVADEAVGVLALYAEDPDFFHADELRLLADLARDIAYAIDHNDKRERLDYLSYYDSLTGLANRTLFLERVDQSMRVATREGHKIALFVMDIERFKNVNDGMGHAAGDVLLRDVALWLTRAIGDASLVARLGSDRFGVMLPKIRAGGDIVHLVEKAMLSFAANEFVIHNTPLRVAVRVGIAIFPDDGGSANALFQNAESALKKAKASGDRYLFYTADMAKALAGSLTLENQLRQAIEREEFVLHYQPKTNLQSGALTGAEALIRWNHPQEGLVAPGRFIPMLEETGLIHEVGRWAIHKAVEDYARWRAAGRNPVPIAVNVSALQLRSPAFIADLKQALSSGEDSAAGLEIEVTESLIMEDAKSGNPSLQAIRGMGIRIAIDDFGTGYSSLGYLARLPVDSLKIDRSFVTDMTSSQEGLLLISTIITLAHSLKLNVVAEGVETEEQARLLRLLNCDEMQGFLYSRPLPAEEFDTKYLGA